MEFNNDDNPSRSEKLHASLIEEALDIHTNLYELNDPPNTFDFHNLFCDLLTQSLIDNFYWQYCPFKVYKSTLKNRIQEFLKQYIDATEIDFFKDELLLIKDNYKQLQIPDEITEGHPVEVAIGIHWYEDYVFCFNIKRKFYDELIIPLHFLAKKINKDIQYTQNKKIEFLNSKLNPQKVQPEELNEKQQPEIFLDYSNNHKVERIVFLHELGILDFLKDKMNNELHYFAANKLAEIVSTFTDIEQNTVQSYLNPIFSDANQKKNILTENNLKKVRNKLKDIGFNKTKTT